MAAPRLHQPHTVSVKAKWAAEWIDVAGLYCDFCKFAASPDVAEAQLSYNFGTVMRAGSMTWLGEGIKNFDDFYVRVTIEQGEGEDPIKWFGVIVDTRQERWGINPPNNVESGRQTFICRGLEYLLQRTVIDRSIVKSGEDTEKEIQRAIAFNLGHGDDTARFRQANRAAGYVGEKGTPIFAEKLDEDNAGTWRGHDIVEYLLGNYSPRDIDGEAKVQFFLDVEASNDILRALEPALHCHGKTLKQILDELIDRRRLMAWTVEVANDSALAPGDAFVRVFTFNKTAITLPSGKTIEPAADQQIFFTDLRSDLVRNLVLAKDTATKFDVVIARGERLGSCFTINNDPDGTLEEDWDATLTTAYNTGATGATGYSGLQSWEKQDANAAYRKDDKFLKVFRYFRVPPTWDGTVGLAEIAFPDPDDEESAVEFWYPGLRFKPYLPLLTEVDYEAGVGEAATIETLEGSKSEYRRPFALIYDLDPDRWYQLDKLSQSTGLSQKEAGGREWSASLRMQDEAFGIIVDVHGWEQHAIAKTEFNGSEGASEPAFPAEMFWENIYATVFVEFDRHVEAKWPETALTTEADHVRRLIINVANARLDYLVPGTLLGVDDDGQALATEGGYVRDDRELLKDIARGSYEWYGESRQAVEFIQRNLVTGFAIGTLITRIGNLMDSIDVNTVVTQLNFDLLRGEIGVRTQFAELDLRG